MEDFKKFDLNENPPTVATDNTLPITISKSDGTGQIEILPEIKKLAIAWIENYIPNNSPMPEIAQKFKLAEDIQRIVNLQRNEVINDAILMFNNNLYYRSRDIRIELTKLKKLTP